MSQDESESPSQVRRVLVADDDPSIRATLSMLLRLEGYEVSTAADGQEALRMAIASRPDVLITDMQMPNMGGQELLASVRADPSLAGVRVVVLTGALPDAALASSEAGGPDACLPKPFSRAQLLDALRS